MTMEYEYLGNFSAVGPAYSRGMRCHDCKVEWVGCWDNFMCPKCGQGELPNIDPPEFINAKMKELLSRRKIKGKKTMNYREYERTLMLNFSENEAVSIGEDAYIDEMMSRNQHEPGLNQPLPLCDICGAADAVTETNGYLVCSESCYLDARSRERKQ